MPYTYIASTEHGLMLRITDGGSHTLGIGMSRAEVADYSMKERLLNTWWETFTNLGLIVT